MVGGGASAPACCCCCCDSGAGAEPWSQLLLLLGWHLVHGASYAGCWGGAPEHQAEGRGRQLR